MLKIGVSILSYRNIKDTLECVESFQSLETKYKVEFVVVDNSEDLSYFNELQSQLKGLKVVHQDENKGYASGNNVGIQILLDNGCDYILVINNDTTINKNFLDILVDSYSKEDGLIAPMIYTYDTKEVWSSGGIYRKFFANHSMTYNLYKEIKEQHFLSGCCFLVSRENILKVGLMDEDYFMYSEDADYSIRFLKHNLKLKVVPSAIIYHKESKSSGKMSAFQIYYMFRGRLLFIHKNYRGFKKLWALLINYAQLGLYFTKYLLKDSKKAKYFWFAFIDQRKKGKVKRNFK